MWENTENRQNKMPIMRKVQKVIKAFALLSLIMAIPLCGSAEVENTEGIDIIYIPSTMGGTGTKVEDESGTYYTLPAVLNGEVVEVAIQGERSEDFPLSLPGVFTNVEYDEEGFITGGTPIEEYSSDYKAEFGLLGSYPVEEDNTLTLNWYYVVTGDAEEETIVTVSDDTRVYNFVEGVATLNEDGIGSVELDHNDQISYYSVDGIVQELYITNVNPTLRLSSPFMDSNGVIFTFYIESHGAMPGDTVTVYVTPLDDVKEETKFSLDVPFMEGYDEVVFEANTPAGTEQTMEFEATTYRASDVYMWISDITNEDDPQTAVGYMTVGTVDAYTGAISPTIPCTFGEGSTVKWYSITHTGDTNLVDVLSAEEISSTIYQSDDDLVLNGEIVQEHINEILTIVVYASSYDGEIDQNLGPVVYKVETTFDSENTDADISLVNDGVQYARLTLADKGADEHTPTTLTIAEIEETGDMTDLSIEGGEVNVPEEISTGEKITYDMNSEDLDENGTISLTIKAE